MSSEQNKVVVHYLDGRLLKGITKDFYPNRPGFHVVPIGGGAPVPVNCRDLKGIFFVNDYVGDGRRRDIQGFISGPGETSHGKKVAVLFRDGELLCGYSLSFSRERDGFFLFPCDKGANNVRVYVLIAATMDIQAGPAADDLAKKTLKNRAA